MHEHTISVPTYVVVCVALIVLTVLTTAVPYPWQVQE